MDPHPLWASPVPRHRLQPSSPSGAGRLIVVTQAGNAGIDVAIRKVPLQVSVLPERPHLYSRLRAIPDGLCVVRGSALSPLLAGPRFLTGGWDRLAGCQI